MYYVYVYSIYMSTSMYKVYSLYRLYVYIYTLPLATGAFPAGNWRASPLVFRLTFSLLAVGAS